MISLRVYLLGNMRLELNQQKVETPATRPVRKLLAYLLLHPNRMHYRDILADLLWGESGPDKARGSLNTAVWYLRKILEPENIPSGTYLMTNRNGEIGFNPHSSHWLDVREFSSQAYQAMTCPTDNVSPAQVSQLVSTLELYNGDLMEGFYDDWIIQEREHLRMLYLKAEGYLMDYYKKNSQLEESIACGQTIIELDPLREEIHRELMRLLMASGQRSLAIRQYEICRDLLKTELGVAPLPETLLLRNQIAGEAAPPSSHPVLDRLSDLKEALNLLQLALQTHELTSEHIQKALGSLEKFSASHLGSRPITDRNTSTQSKGV